jgi:hypothetical protein
MPSSGDGFEPILDDEILYRRVPVSMDWYDREKNPPLNYFAFRPTRNDKTPLSVYRHKYKTAQQVAASPRPGARYYVAELRAGDLRSKGINVVPAPRPGDPGHAEIPNLSYENKDTSRAIEIQKTLAEELCLRVHGPFPPM